MFTVEPSYAAQATALYVAIYAFGRLFAGFLAQRIGSFRTYDILVFSMLVFLVSAPQTALYMPNHGSNSSGCKLFVTFLCLIGLMVRYRKEEYYCCCGCDCNCYCLMSSC